MVERRIGGSQRIPRPRTWELGGLPSWVQAAPPLHTADSIAERVTGAGLDKKIEPPLFAGGRSSAVLIVLADGPNGAEVLLTKRSQHLRHHPGEISFPGGRMDPGESPTQAALREAAEEVDLRHDDVRIRGQLSALSTLVSNSYIVPIVAELAAATERPVLQALTTEVDRIMWVPLAELIRPDTFRLEHWQLGTVQRPIHFFELDDETIWGATGRMLFQLLELIYGPPATRTAL